MEHQIHIIPIKTNKITVLLGAVTLFLILMNLIVQVLRMVTGDGWIYGLVPLFLFDTENNIPTFWSSAMLLFAASLLGVIAYSKIIAIDKYRYQWVILAWGFLYLAIDESASLHEKLNLPMQILLMDKATGYLGYPWVIPGAIVVIILAIVFFKFLLHLPGFTRQLFILAAICYVSGTIGLEMMSSYYIGLEGNNELIITILVSFEDTFEMVGVVFFIYALLEYMSKHIKQLQFDFK